MRKTVFIHETATIDEGATIGDGCKIWHYCHLMSGSILGQDCSLGQNVFVASGVKLGSNVKVQNNVSIYEGVECEDNVFLGPSMVFTNVLNPRSAVNRRGEYTRTVVREGVTIGANATIVCGIELGEFAFIGAGAVVTKNVPAYALIIGNPGQQTAWMSEYGHKLNFNSDNIAQCPESNQLYELVDGTVRKK